MDSILKALLTLPDAVKHILLGVLIAVLFGLAVPFLLAWMWNNLPGAFGAPVFFYFNGLALEILILLVIGTVVLVKDVK